MTNRQVTDSICLRLIKSLSLSSIHEHHNDKIKRKKQTNKRTKRERSNIFINLKRMKKREKRIPNKTTETLYSNRENTC